MDCFMLMQCAITSGLRRPRNLSPSCRPPAPHAPTPAFAGRGAVLDVGRRGRRRGGGKAAGCLGRDAGCGALSPGGSERERRTRRERAPARGAAREARGIIKEEVVPAPSQTHLHSTSPALISFSQFPDAICLLNNSAAASHWR